MVDFTNCPVYNKTYSGANGSKLCIGYNGAKHMLKFPSYPTRETSLHYVNGCVSEYIGCHIYEMIGIPVQETILGTYTKNGKEKQVVACKDFTDIGIVIQDFGSVKNQIIDSIHDGYGTELTDVLQAIDEQNGMDPLVVKQRFWDMFVVDALLGNFDRHNGNWGFLYNQLTDQISLAPVYDCASSLFPHADVKTMEKVLNNQDELYARVYNFPTSAIKTDNRKIPYHSFLTTTDDRDCLWSLVSIYERIHMDDICAFIEDMGEIDDLQKEFYTTVLNARYDLILTPAYTRALELMHMDRNLEEPDLDNDLYEDFDPADD